MCGAIGHLLLADNDEDVVVGLVLVRRQRGIDPIAARVTAEQDDLQDTRAIAAPSRILRRMTEFIKDDFDDALKLAPLRAGQMIEVGAHRQESSKIGRASWRERVGQYEEISVVA